MIHDLGNDLRLAVRSLLRRPLAALGIVATLTLGIAATIAVYAVLDALLLRPLPYPEPDRLVRVWGEIRAPGAEARYLPLNPLDVADLERGAPAVEAIGAWTRTSQPMSGAGDPVMVSVGLATPGLFRVLGVEARLGRLLGREHESAERENEILVSHAFWAGRLGTDPGVLGRVIRLADVPCTIIGVLAPEFASPNATLATEPEVWRPYVIRPAEGRRAHFMMAAARLRPGASLAQVREQFDAVAARLERDEPATNRGTGAHLAPLAESVAGGHRAVLLAAMAAAGFVLLIACANAASLLMARATTRRREIAVRGALGAGRWRIVRQLLGESLALATAASLLGLAAAWGLLRALPAALSGVLPAVQPLGVDARVLAFAVVLAAGTALLCGLAPAIAATRGGGGGRAGIAAVLAGAGGGGGRGATTDARRLHFVLLAAQTALASMLLVSAILLLESASRLERIDPGFARQGVLTFRVSLPATRYADPAAIRAFTTLFEERLAALPGVAAAGAVDIGPMTGRHSCDRFALADRPAPPQGAEPCAEARVATPGYFDAMGIALRGGRGFSGADTERGAPVVLINEAMARRHWPSADPIGQRLRWGGPSSEEPWRTVVGVVGDVRHFGRDTEAPPEVYMPGAQRPARALTFALRARTANAGAALAAGDPAALGPAARAALASIDPALPIAEAWSTRQILERSNALRRLRTWLFGASALVALALAMFGIYAVSSFLTATRRREIGIRVALGASPAAVRRAILARSLGAPLVGLLAGLAASLAAGRLLQSLLFAVSPTDPVAFIAAPGVLLAAAVLAGLLPARRAAATDPLEALRGE